MSNNLVKPFGVYMKPNGKLILVEPREEGEEKWVDLYIDEGKSKNHPLFRVKFSVKKMMSWGHFSEKELKGCEFLGPLDTNVLFEEALHAVNKFIHNNPTLERSPS